MAHKGLMTSKSIDILKENLRDIDKAGSDLRM
jgi:hypothetical protein